MFGLINSAIKYQTLPHFSSPLHLLKHTDAFMLS